MTGHGQLRHRGRRRGADRARACRLPRRSPAPRRAGRPPGPRSHRRTGRRRPRDRAHRPVRGDAGGARRLGTRARARDRAAPPHAGAERPLPLRHAVGRGPVRARADRALRAEPGVAAGPVRGRSRGPEGRRSVRDRGRGDAHGEAGHVAPSLGRPHARGAAAGRRRCAPLAAPRAARHRGRPARLRPAHAGLRDDAPAPSRGDRDGLVRIRPHAGDAAAERRAVVGGDDARRGGVRAAAGARGPGVRGGGDRALSRTARGHAPGGRPPGGAGGDRLRAPVRRTPVRTAGRCRDRDASDHRARLQCRAARAGGAGRRPSRGDRRRMRRRGSGRAPALRGPPSRRDAPVLHGRRDGDAALCGGRRPGRTGGAERSGSATCRRSARC